MSALTTAERAGTMTGRRAGGVGMLDALHAEWTKLRTVSGPSWLLLGIVALTVAVSVVAVGATSCPASMRCAVDPAKLSLAGVQFGQAVVAILAVLTLCNEYSTGMIKVTLTAMPRRLEMYAAKAIITAGVVLLAGAVAVLGSVLAGNLILPGHGFTTARGFHQVSLSYGPVLRAAGRCWRPRRSSRLRSRSPSAWWLPSLPSRWACRWNGTMARSCSRSRR